MAYQHINIPQEARAKTLSTINDISTVVDAPGHLHVIKEDPSDDVILETAVVGNADFLVTGDSHLLRLKNYQGIRILTPAEFLEEIKR